MLIIQENIASLVNQLKIKVGPSALSLSTNQSLRLTYILDYYIITKSPIICTIKYHATQIIKVHSYTDVYRN